MKKLYQEKIKVINLLVTPVAQKILNVLLNGDPF
jgi:hypothetical protein